MSKSNYGVVDTNWEGRTPTTPRQFPHCHH